MGIAIGSLQDINMYKLAITLVCLIGFSQATPTREVRSKTKDLLCDICVDVVTDLDNWTTSDSTMDEIIDSTAGNHHPSFFILHHSSFIILHSSFFILHSSFILYSSFIHPSFILHSSFIHP